MTATSAQSLAIAGAVGLLSGTQSVVASLCLAIIS